MAARNSGSKVVAVAVAASLFAVGLGSIYLPYFADRDKLRGLHEEADGGLSERERREFELYMRQIQSQQQQGAPGGGGAGMGNEKSPLNGNSMWSRMNQASANKKE